MDEDAPKLKVRLIGRDGRRRYDPASRDQLVAVCLEPGVSVCRLAREHSVNANLVRNWIKKAMKEHPLPSASAFVPVQIAPDMPPTSSGDLLTKSVTLGKPFQTSKVSALLPNGISLTVEYGLATIQERWVMCTDAAATIPGQHCHRLHAGLRTRPQIRLRHATLSRGANVRTGRRTYQPGCYRALGDRFERKAPASHLRCAEAEASVAASHSP